MTYKSDKVPCCFLMLVVKINGMNVHDLECRNNLRIKEYQLITLLHIRIMHAQISCEYTQAILCIGLGGAGTDQGL